MIVKYVWITQKGAGKTSIERHWRGWFLFGIIPLYIDNSYTKIG